MSAENKPTNNSTDNLLSEIETYPAEWGKVKLGNIAKIRGGIGFPVKYQGKDESQGKYPFFKVSDMNLPRNHTYMNEANNWVDDGTIKSLKAKFFPPKSIIFPKVGAAVYTNKKRITIQSCLVDNNVMGIFLEDSNSYEPMFLLYFFYTVDLRDVSNIGPLPSINARTIKELLVPCPPLPEQKAIAHVLSTVQRAKEATEQVIQATKEFKKSLMKHLFTYGAVPVEEADKVKLKEAEIGMLPAHWRLKKANQVFEKVTDGTHDTPKKLTQGVPLVTSKLIKGGRVEVEKADYFISPHDHSIISKRSGVDSWDILYSMIGTIGEIAVVTPGYSEFSIKNVGLFKTASNKFLASYCGYWFQSNFARDYVNNNTSGTSQRYVPLGFLRNFPIPIPSNNELEKVVNIMSALDMKLSVEYDRSRHLDELFKSLLNNLMTGRIRVSNFEAGDNELRQ